MSPVSAHMIQNQVSVLPAPNARFMAAVAIRPPPRSSAGENLARRAAHTTARHDFTTRQRGVGGTERHRRSRRSSRRSSSSSGDQQRAGKSPIQDPPQPPSAALTMHTEHTWHLQGRQATRQCIVRTTERCWRPTASAWCCCERLAWPLHLARASCCVRLCRRERVGQRPHLSPIMPLTNLLAP
jgi:hypothetical protein